jgi:hypothetical protein
MSRSVCAAPLAAPPAAALARVIVALLALAAPSLAPAVHAEIPALSRRFDTEDFRRTPQDLENLAKLRHVALGVSGGAWWAGREAGSWNAFRSGSPWGARAEALARYGRWTLGADATNDGSLNADAREYGQRLTGAVHVPEVLTALTGAIGYERWHHRGSDLSAEFAPLRWNTRLKSMDLKPNLWFWTRVRKLEGDSKAIVTPAAALAIQHFVVLGSQASIALSAQSDVSDGATPATFGMFQLYFESVPHSISGGGGDADMPLPVGASAPSLIDHNWFAMLGYGFPLDDRSPGRLAVQFGMRFTRPYGGS